MTNACCPASLRLVAVDTRLLSPHDTCFLLFTAPGLVSQALRDVRCIVLVLSGKGGVGKSSVASQLAWSAAAAGNTVGLLDVDICGPSVPRMAGKPSGAAVHSSGTGWSPVWVSDRLAVMSVGFMLPGKDDAIIWRGPRKNGLIRQFLTDVAWGPLDMLVIDTPPGTSDEHISIVQFLAQANLAGAVIVTTPQEVAMADVRKELSFCARTKLPVLGVIENMAGIRCASCGTEQWPFAPANGGGAGLASQAGVPFLGRLPLDPALTAACEEGVAFVAQHPDAPAAAPLQRIVNKLLNLAGQAVKVTLSSAPDAAEAEDSEAAVLESLRAEEAELQRRLAAVQARIKSVEPT